MLKYCFLKYSPVFHVNFESSISRVAKLEDIKFKDRTDLICDSQPFETDFFSGRLCGERIIWKLLTAESCAK